MSKYLVNQDKQFDNGNKRNIKNIKNNTNTKKSGIFLNNKTIQRMKADFKSMSQGSV